MNKCGLSNKCDQAPTYTRGAGALHYFYFLKIILEKFSPCENYEKGSSDKA